MYKSPLAFYNLPRIVSRRIGRSKAAMKNMSTLYRSISLGPPSMFGPHCEGTHLGYPKGYPPSGRCAISAKGVKRRYVRSRVRVTSVKGGERRKPIFLPLERLQWRRKKNSRRPSVCLCEARNSNRPNVLARSGR